MLKVPCTCQGLDGIKSVEQENTHIPLRVHTVTDIPLHVHTGGWTIQKNHRSIKLKLRLMIIGNSLVLLFIITSEFIRIRCLDKLLLVLSMDTSFQLIHGDFHMTYPLQQPKPYLECTMKLHLNAAT